MTSLRGGSGDVLGCPRPVAEESRQGRASDIPQGLKPQFNVLNPMYGLEPVPFSELGFPAT
jgi:hypothetical protein